MTIIENNEESSSHSGDIINIDSIEGEGIAVGRNARVEINKRYGDIIVRVDTLEELPPKLGAPPYKGLAYFTEADADIFLGREEISKDLAARLDLSPFLAVVGASGSGKSSLLRAGIIPILRQHNWLIHIISPTADPLGQLANSLTRDESSLSSASELRTQLVEEPRTLRRVAKKLAARENAEQFLLIVDQFEELFTQNPKENERRAMLDNILAASSEGGINILIGLRADFTGHLTEPKELLKLVQKNIVLLGRMEHEDLVRVLMEPARIGGWAFVDGLVEQILKDVGREPGRLPLLSHALLETWKRRAAHVMTLKGYQEAGGVDGAIAKTAEDTLYRLGDSEKRAIMQAILLELTELGEEAEDTRRITHRDVLANIGDEANVNSVLEALVKARLVIVDGDRVEVAHEALIRRWPMLREWLKDNRERLRFERQLQRDALLWEELERDDGTLYRGARLARATELVDSGEVRLTELSALFFTTSQELATREEQEREQQLQKELNQARELAQNKEETRREIVRVNRRNLALIGIVSAIAVALIAYTSVIPFFMRRAAANDEFAELVPVEMEDGSIVEFEVFEVTNERYAKCVDFGPCNRPNGFQELEENSWDDARRLPVVGLDASDAMTFCQWLDRTLPTAEQWDSAVVAVDKWRSMPADQAVFCRDEPCKLEPVGYRTVSQNPLGLPLFDFVGNASEWTRTIEVDGRCNDVTEFVGEKELTVVLGDNYLVSPGHAGFYERVNDQQWFSDTRISSVGFRCVLLEENPSEKEYDCPSLLD